MANKITNKSKASSIFWWTIKRNLPITIVCAVLTFFMFPATMVFNGIMDALVVSMGTDNKYTVNIEDYVDIISELAPSLAGTIFAGITIIFSIVIAIATFSYMHNKRSMDFFGSMPVSRNTMFFARYAAAIVGILVPIVVVGSFGAGLTLSWPVAKQVFEIMAYIILGTVGNITFIGVLSLCCGTTIETVCSYVGVNIAYPICIALLNFMPQVVVPGVGEGIWPASVYTLFCPVAAPFTMAFGDGKTLNVVWWILLIIGLNFANAVLCKKRKSEIAQAAYTQPILEYAVKFIVSVTAGVGIGWLLSYGSMAFMSVTVQYIFYAVGMLIGIAVANLLLHILYHRGLKGYLKNLVSCIACAVVCVVYVAIVGTGMLGADTGIPNINDIQSVSLSYEYSDEFYIDGENVLKEYRSDSESITAIYNIHEQLIDDITKYKSSGLYPLTGISMFKEMSNEEYEYYDGVTVSYKLKDGTIVNKDYSYFEVEFAIDEKLYDKSNSQILLDIASDKYVDYIYLYLGESYGYNGIEFNTQKDISIVYEALQKDIAEVGYINDFADLEFEISYCDERGSWVYATIYADDTYVNTMAALKELGYTNLAYNALEKLYTLDEYSEIQEAGVIYFNLPEGMDPNKEVLCLQSYPYDEYLFNIKDEKTKCERVDEDTWKYTYYEVINDDYYKDVKKIFTLVQVEEDTVITSGKLKMPKNKDVDTVTIKGALLNSEGQPVNNISEEMYEYEWSNSSIN